MEHYKVQYRQVRILRKEALSWKSAEQDNCYGQWIKPEPKIDLNGFTKTKFLEAAGFYIISSKRCFRSTFWILDAQASDRKKDGKTDNFFFVKFFWDAPKWEPTSYKHRENNGKQFNLFPSIVKALCLIICQFQKISKLVLINKYYVWL